MGTDTITILWIIKKRTFLSSFFCDFVTEFYATGSGAFTGSIDDLFPSMLYITPKGWFRKKSIRPAPSEIALQLRRCGPEGAALLSFCAPGIWSFLRTPGLGDFYRDH